MKLQEEHFCVFPAMGYWEIDGKPVSSREARKWLTSACEMDSHRSL